MSVSIRSLVETAGEDPILDDLLEEFTNQLENGAPVDAEAFIRAHPERADALRRMLPVIQVLVNFDRPAEGMLSLLPGGLKSQAMLGELGDFRILREIGRGGMGIVYEAEQISLGRRVALKVLPFAAALDAKHLQRFRNEAHAAAQLHHQNIVPVYGVGCERSVHFYAMQFIDGQTVADLIAELRREAGLEPASNQARADRGSSLAQKIASERWPPSGRDKIDPGATGNYSARVAAPEAPPGQGETRPQANLTTHRSKISPAYFRTIVNLGLQAAAGLEHAHQLGIIHRDIKPANLLFDVRGNLWITDFGLAQIRGDVKLTMTGDLLGTLRYMSPEQALAKHASIDHRADIYSLGVTLYELLTLEPAFGGQDRQELLRKIAFDEPRPPRALNRQIPSELETIVLKAIAKHPEERYATAQELADDMERFLEDRPILARRPRLAQRLRKWSWRHQPIVWTAGIATVLMLIVAVVGLKISNLRIEAEKTLTREQREEAEANLRRARKAVDEQFTLVSQSKLFDAPGFESLRKELLESALNYYQDFLQQKPDDPELQSEVVAAHLRLSEIHQAIDGEFNPAAMQQLERGVEIVERLLRTHGNDAAFYTRLAGFAKARRTLHGGYSAAEAQPPETDIIALYRRTAAIWKGFAQTFPNVAGFRSDLIAFYFAIQEIQGAIGRSSEAIVTLRKALAISEQLVLQHPDVSQYRSQLADAHDAFTLRAEHTILRDQVESHFRKAIELRQALANEEPQVHNHRYKLAGSEDAYGQWLARAGRGTEAEAAISRSLALQEKLVIKFPEMPAYRSGLALTQEGLGHLYRTSGKTDSAERMYRKALDQWDRLAEQFPSNENYRIPYASYCLCVQLTVSGRSEEANKIFGRILEFNSATPNGKNLLAWSLAARPEFSDMPRALELAKAATLQAPRAGYVWNTLGLAYYRNGKYREAVKALERSMELGSGGDSFDRILLAMAHWKLGNKDQARSWYSQAIQWNETREQHAFPEMLRQDLKRFINEAIEMMGLKNQTTAKEKS